MVDEVKKLMKQMTEPKTPIGDDLFIPNHSGDHSAGRMLRTPSNDYDIANKKYVDDTIASEALWARTGTQLDTATAGDDVKTTGSLIVDGYKFSDSGTNLIIADGASEMLRINFSPNTTLIHGGTVDPSTLELRGDSVNFRPRFIIPGTGNVTLDLDNTDKFFISMSGTTYGIFTNDTEAQLQLFGTTGSWNYSAVRLGDSGCAKFWNIMHRKEAAHVNDLMFEYYNGSSYSVKCKYDVSAAVFDVVAGGYAINGTAGASGSFTTTDGKTVTVTKGLITAIV